MHPIFNQEGITVGWLNDNAVIYDLEGEAIAFIRGNAVYNYDGNQLGWIQNGFFRDGNGDAIAFMNGVQGGPLPPLPEIPPIPTIPAIPPLPPIPDIPGLAPMPSLDWSQLTWDNFIA